MASSPSGHHSADFWSIRARYSHSSSSLEVTPSLNTAPRPLEQRTKVSFFCLTISLRFYENSPNPAREEKLSKSNIYNLVFNLIK